MTFHFPPPPPEAQVFWLVRRPSPGVGREPQHLTSFAFGTSGPHTTRWQGRRDAAHEFTSRPLARACAIALGATLIKVTRRTS